MLVTISAEADSPAVVGLVLGCSSSCSLALDVPVFRWANHVSDRTDPSQMLVTEKVFGFLLASLAVQLILDGLHSVGANRLSGH
jgi:small neutral amino acid transporter SnatA (MarC family)